MINIKANNEGVILIVSTEAIINATCKVEYLPDDFNVYVSEGKYKANEQGLYVTDGWIDYTEEEWEDKLKYLEKGEVWIRNKKPKSITPRQGMILLNRRGQLTMIEQVIYNIETITGDKQLAEEALIEYNKASTWDRQNNTVQFIADLLMWSDEDIDEFFIEANKII